MNAYDPELWHDFAIALVERLPRCASLPSWRSRSTSKPSSRRPGCLAGQGHRHLDSWWSVDGGHQMTS